MAQLLTSLTQRYYDSNGLPLAGGKLYSYAAGTSTPLATFVDSTEATPNTNPIILDATGSASVWINSLNYKFVLTDSLGIVQFTRDNVTTLSDLSVTTAKLVDASVTNSKLAVDAVALLNMQDNSVGTTELINNSVTTVKILDQNVTTSKIADNNVTFGKISVGTIPGLVNVQLTGSSGSWVVPARCTTIIVQGAGGGGGGEAGNIGSAANAAGGGGGVGTVPVTSLISVTPGETLTYLIGTGGSGAVYSGASAMGGGTTNLIRGGAQVIFSAKGGSTGTPGFIGGVNVTTASPTGFYVPGGSGGTAFGGSPGFSFVGAGGGGGNNVTTYGNSGGGGGGGGSGALFGYGLNGATSYGYGGSGGSAVVGGIGGSGTNATGYCAGGGGGAAGNNNAGGGGGGNGTGGFLIIAYSQSV